MTGDRAQPPNPASDPLLYGELPLSEERWAYLRPRLSELLEDFRKLEELEAPELEPAPAGWRPEGDDDDRR